nr:L,D-transpeptidase family protein [Streptomyces sp. NBC_00995]
MQVVSRPVVATLATVSALLLGSACGSQTADDAAASPSDPPAAASVAAAAEASAEPSVLPSATTSASASTSPSASASASRKPSRAPASKSSSAPPTKPTAETQQQPSAPSFPVPVEVGNATQVITVRAGGSYATVTAWQKGASGWKSQFSTTAGRVGSNGVTNGSTRRQNTYTTPSGTYTLTEGFGVRSGGTAMPYTVVNSGHWWVEDPESRFYNQMHSATGADFPLTETGDRGSEHLIDYPTQYAKALVINYNRWPAVPGRGAGIFLHVNGSGATAGCVSVPRPTMDRIMAWISPSAHPRIAIG